MNPDIECQASFEALELWDDAVRSEMYLLADGAGGWLAYPIHLFPERGRYLTTFDATVSISTSSRDTGRSVTPDVSECRFEGEIVDSGLGEVAFDLFDDADESAVARMQLSRDSVPDRLSEEGDSCFVSIRLEYDHAAALNRHSEDELRRRRAELEERLERLRAEYP